MTPKEIKAYQHSLKVLKGHHIRITPQSQLLLRYLICNHTHPSIDQIHKALSQQMSNMSVATLYNSLDLFNKLGLTISLPGKDNRVRFDYFGKPHFHAICKRCGKIFDIFDKNYPELNERLKKLAKDQADFDFAESKVEIFGLCSKCKKELSKKN